MIKKLVSFLLVINCFLLISSEKKIERRSVSAILSSIPWIESREGTPDNKSHLPVVNQIESPKPSSNDDNEQTHFPSLNVDSQK